MRGDMMHDTDTQPQKDNNGNRSSSAFNDAKTDTDRQSTTFQHHPVMLAEVLEGLAIQPEGVYVDATFGRGGHSRGICRHLGATGRLIALDQDPAAIEYFHSCPNLDQRLTLVHASFADLSAVIQAQGVLGRVNGIVFDCGVSSPQLEDPSRGFSFMQDGPLDMRMNPQHGEPASAWLNRASASEIADVIYTFGQERYSRRIAAAIVLDRQKTPFVSTRQLADLIARVVPTRQRGKHPATRSFQAIRIFMNEELKALEAGLAQCLDVLAVGGRICAISFHSLEDRIIKRFYQREARGEQNSPHYLRLKIIKRLVRPSPSEVRSNPRARSAILRIAEKIA